MLIITSSKVQRKVDRFKPTMKSIKKAALWAAFNFIQKMEINFFRFFLSGHKMII